MCDTDKPYQAQDTAQVSIPGSFTFGGRLAVVHLPPPDKLILRDETGQAWAVSVRSDGQLQTAKYPDGEPMTPSDYTERSIMATFKPASDSESLSFVGLPVVEAEPDRVEEDHL